MLIAEVQVSDRKNMLVVEDEPAIRKLVARILSGHFTDQLNIHLVDNGTDAVNLIESGTDFHILLTNFYFPGGDGNSVAEAFAAKFPTARRFGMSGGHAAQFKSGVVEEVFQKPFNPAQLIARIHQAI